MAKFLIYINSAIGNGFKFTSTFIKKYQHLSVFIGIVLLFVSPFLLSLTSFWDKFDFSNTGQIGDTIGGITSPFIGLIGAILVYRSFKEQIKANQIQMKYIENEAQKSILNKNYELSSKLLNDFLDDFEKFKFNKFVSFDRRDEIYGQEAFDVFCAYFNRIRVKDIEQSVADTYIYTFSQFLFICKKLENNTYNHDDKDILDLKIKLIYETKIRSGLKTIINSSFENRPEYYNRILSLSIEVSKYF